jgi:hypothetical protein
VTDEARSLEWQLAEVGKAVSVAERNAARFGLTAAEVGARRAWVAAAKGEAEALRAAVAAAKPAGGRPFGAPPPGAPPPSAGSRANDAFLAGAEGESAQLFAQQDAQLDHLGAAVARIGEVGLAIHGELESQAVALDELAADTDATGARLAAARRKVATVLEKAGIKAQLAIIGGLVVMLVVLTMVAFS